MKSLALLLPRLGRMILEAGRQGCVREVLIITAALSIQDPRERPTDAREAADAMHARFAEPGSDFLTFLTLWDYLHERQRELSGSAFRRMADIVANMGWKSVGTCFSVAAVFTRPGAMQLTVTLN